MEYNGIKYIKINNINRNLVLLADQWPPTNLYNILNTKTNKVFFENGVQSLIKAGNNIFCYSQINGYGFNYINYKGKILVPGEYFQFPSKFYRGFAIVYKDNLGYNIINTQGEYIFNMWFNRILREYNSDIYLATINENKCILDVFSRKIYIKI